jgi:hypoxanthine phosphoribosyltransferase
MEGKIMRGRWATFVPYVQIYRKDKSMNHILGFIIGVISSICAAWLLRYATERYSSHISFRRIFKSIIVLYRKIQADGYMPDYIIGVDRNGSIVGSILSGYFGFSTIIAAATKTVRHPEGYRESEMCPTHLPAEDALAQKKILIVSCFVDTGSALERVYKYYNAMPNRPSEIRTAALYTNPSPRLKPTYFVFEMGKDIKMSLSQIMSKMPWMSDGWKYVLDGEQISRSA